MIIKLEDVLMEVGAILAIAFVFFSFYWFFKWIGKKERKLDAE